MGFNALMSSAVFQIKLFDEMSRTLSTGSFSQELLHQLSFLSVEFAIAEEDTMFFTSINSFRITEEW